MFNVLNLISNNLQKKTIFISVPLWFGVFIAISLKVITFGKVDYIEKVQRMTEDRCISHEEAKKDFGYKPESIYVGIEREVGKYLQSSRYLDNNKK